MPAGRSLAQRLMRALLIEVEAEGVEPPLLCRAVGRRRRGHGIPSSPPAVTSNLSPMSPVYSVTDVPGPYPIVPLPTMGSG